jgi:hypothetical protein
MEENRSSKPDRRRVSRNGRRVTDPTPEPLGVALRTSATLLWELPDATRCWIMRHRRRVIVHVSRGSEDLRVDLFASEVDAKAAADEWLMEFGAAV